MTRLTGSSTMQQRTASLLSSAPILGVHLRKLVAEFRRCVPGQFCLAQAWGDQVDDDASFGDGDQWCEVSDCEDFEQFGCGVSKVVVN
jgi:hypothetical protein